jgi:hypothetical protein
VKRAAFAIAALFAFGAPTSAQDAPRSAVDVVAAGAPAALEAMADRVRSLESRFPVSVRWRVADAIDVRAIIAPRATGDSAFARVWLDLSNPERAVLFIANAGQDRFLVRVVPVGDGYGELTRESLATVVESAIDALLAGGEIGVDRSAAAREIEAQTGTAIAVESPAPPRVVAAESVPAVVDPSAASAPEQLAWLLTAGYRVDAIADGPKLRHAAQLALSWCDCQGQALALLLGVSVQFFPPFSLGNAGRRVAERGGGARAAIGATLHAPDAFVFQAALGMGVDLLRIEPEIAADTGLQAAEPFSITAEVATLFVTGGWRPAAWIDIGLGVGLDVALSGPHFDVQSGSTRTRAISPFRAHPYALVSIGTPFSLGAGR